MNDVIYIFCLAGAFRDCNISALNETVAEVSIALHAN